MAQLVTRSEAVPVLAGIVVAPVTRTVRHIPTEVHLGADEGLAVECVASFDNLQRVRQAALVARIGSLAPGRSEMGSSLRTLADC